MVSLHLLKNLQHVTCYSLLQDCYSLISILLGTDFFCFGTTPVFLTIMYVTSYSKDAISTLDSINMYLFMKAVASSC